MIADMTENGLEYKPHNEDQWYRITKRPGYAYMFTGGLMELLTDNNHEKPKIPATIHRVTGTTDECKNERTSFTYFYRLNYSKPWINLHTGKPVEHDSQPVKAGAEYRLLQLKKVSPDKLEQKCSERAFRLTAFKSYLRTQT
jgi:isopenicillin N synthase-like dioxygenase